MRDPLGTPHACVSKASRAGYDDRRMHASHCERSLRYRIFLIATSVALLSLLSLPSPTHAANLLFTPASGSYATGAQFTLKVAVDPGGQTVNASDGAIKFDPAVLSVNTVSKDGSAFSLWTADPSFSNSAGTVSFSGGSPSGFATQSAILSITFTAKAVGSTTVSFTKGSILAADGKGTDIYQTGKDANLTITAAAAAAAPAAPAPTATASTDSSSLSGDPTPIAPQIASVNDPKSDSWYASSTADFYWVDTQDITGARIIVASSSATIPSKVLKGAATSTIEANIADGVWYFIAQLKNGSGWGPSGTFKVQIDTTPPDTFTIGLVTPAADGGVAKFSFKTHDAMSGIDLYELMVGSTTDQTLAAADVGTDGTYPIPAQDGGPIGVTISAFDKAGNMRTVTQTLTLPKVAKPVAATADVPGAPAAIWSLESVIIIAILMAIIGMLFGWNRFSKKQMQAERSRILKRVAEVRDTNDRVFSAMREEFELMINDFDPKPQLTPEERELLESVKEVLDISEELIDSGIEDVKKMVRG